MADPAHPHTAHLDDARLAGQGGFGGVDERRVNAVEQAAEHVTRGSAKDRRNGHGDDQPDDGVRQWEAKPDADRAQHHGE